MNFFKNLLKSDFSKNVLTLMTGTTIAQAIPIAITPILTRIYTPEDFGILALFMSITAILGVVSSAKYEQAIMLPKSKKESLSIVYLSVLISTVFSLLLLLTVLVLKERIVFLLKEPKIENWLYFIPISVFFIGLFNALKIYNVRTKNFKQVSVSMVSKSSGLAITQLGVGFIKTGALGLILGQVISYVVGNLQLLKVIINDKTSNTSLDLKNILQVTKTYHRFPKYTLPGSLLNIVTLNSINFFIVAVYTTSVLGFFSLARRLLSLPSVILGDSIGQVFFQKISETKNKEQNVLKVFNTYLKKLILISLPTFTIVFFTIEPIFEFFFGDDWLIAGQMAKIIVPLACVRFVSSTMSSTLHVFQKQQYTFFIQTIQFATVIAIFWFSQNRNINFMDTLKCYSAILSIEYLLFAMVYWKVVKQYEAV